MELAWLKIILYTWIKVPLFYNHWKPAAETFTAKKQASYEPASHFKSSQGTSAAFTVVFRTWIFMKIYSAIPKESRGLSRCNHHGCALLSSFPDLNSSSEKKTFLVPATLAFCPFLSETSPQHLNLAPSLQSDPHTAWHRFTETKRRRRGKRALESGWGVYCSK